MHVAFLSLSPPSAPSLLYLPTHPFSNCQIRDVVRVSLPAIAVANIVFTIFYSLLCYCAHCCCFLSAWFNINGMYDLLRLVSFSVIEAVTRQTAVPNKRNYVYLPHDKDCNAGRESANHCVWQCSKIYPKEDNKRNYVYRPHDKDCNAGRVSASHCVWQCSKIYSKKGMYTYHTKKDHKQRHVFGS